MNECVELPEPWRKPWPSEALEAIGACPVCGDEGRELLYEDLVDNVFRVASGKWQLWRCLGCRSAYLDPRPSQGSIHMAYRRYFTHRRPEGRDDFESLNPLRKLRRRLVNGYTNWRYSTENQPASALGVGAAYATPPLRRVIDRQYRHLPHRPDTGGRILDVGCGDGYFLGLARSCGWDVMGVDPDPEAGAIKQGFAVRQGGIECLDGESDLFDAITLSHAIEHVHDPVDVLRRCHTLLKLRGQLWIETPNIDALGHKRYRRHWRGLEPPRHLVIFNRDSLGIALCNAGFTAVIDRRTRNPHLFTFRESKALQIVESDRSAIELSNVERWAARLAAFRAEFQRGRREFLTLTANK